jgi:hypothetical protein
MDKFWNSNIECGDDSLKHYCILEIFQKERWSLKCFHYAWASGKNVEGIYRLIN